jgi:hypothetical protein
LILQNVFGVRPRLTCSLFSSSKNTPFNLSCTMQDGWGPWFFIPDAYVVWLLFVFLKCMNIPRKICIHIISHKNIVKILNTSQRQLLVVLKSGLATEERNA